MAPVCYQVDLQPGFGGGERYAISFSRALAALGVRTVMFANPAARFWEKELPESARVVPVATVRDIQHALPRGACWLAFHTPAGESGVSGLRQAGHYLTCFAHMPLYGRDPTVLGSYALVFPVSGHVLASLHVAGIVATAYPEPLYGAADLGVPHKSGSKLTGPYQWDRRKLRDRLFGVGYGIYERFNRREPFVRRSGISLGIVSRLTPIKQFPLLFHHLAPVIARHKAFSLEIFGAGGYASVRDLRAEVRQLGDQVRFCGWQQNVAGAYANIDYLLTGLPEREALGLNVLEAQACGSAVLAVDAPPFTETVQDEVTGLFYSDPRLDDGADFERLLTRLEKTPFRIDAERAGAHLSRFTLDALRVRVARLLDHLAARGVVV